MITAMLKHPSRPTRANAPAVGSHLPLLSDMIAASTAVQMNTSVITKNQGVEKSLPLLKNTSMAVMQENASVPPSQTGLVTQYRKLLIAPARWPKASRVHR